MTTIYMFPGLTGDPNELTDFVASCRASFRVVVIDYPQWTTRRTNRLNLRQLIAQCLQQINPMDEVVLVGYSFGGHLAFAVAAELAASADVTVCMLDTAANADIGTDKDPEPGGLGQRLGQAWDDLMWRSHNRLARFIVEGPDLLFRLVTGLGGVNRLIVKAIQINMNLPVLLDILQWMSQLTSPIPVRVKLFRCATHNRDMGRDLGWRSYAKQVEVTDIPGNHRTVVDLANATAVADKLQHAIIEGAAAD